MEDCPVCLDSVNTTNFNTLPCNHNVCKNCFPKLRIPICPLCRAPFGDTNTDLYDNQVEYSIVVEIDYDLFDFMSPRQRRRQRNRQYSNLQHRPRPPRPRNITSSQPISIININDTIIDNRNIQTRKKLPEHKRYKRNHKKRNNISNTWNFLRNQHNIP